MNRRVAVIENRVGAGGTYPHPHSFLGCAVDGVVLKISGCGAKYVFCISYTPYIVRRTLNKCRKMPYAV